MARVVTSIVMAGLLAIAGIPGAQATVDLSGSGSATVPRVIEIEADAALRFMQGGQPLHDIPVIPGEMLVFRVDNTAGFDQNFYIGTRDELSVPLSTTEIGISTWTTGARELRWTVPDDVAGLMFGCTVPGHFPYMQGTISAVTALPDVTIGPQTSVPSVTRASGRIEVPWAGMALTLPPGWSAEVYGGPSSDPGVPSDIMWASGDGFCVVSANDADAYDRWEAALRSDDIIDLADASALRFDSVIPSGDWTAYRTTYVVVAPSRVYLIECDGWEPQKDAWLSIIETFEVLPEQG